MEGERDDLLIEIHELEGERDEFEGRFELEKEKNGKLVEEVEMRDGEIEGWKGRVDQLENELEDNKNKKNGNLNGLKMKKKEVENALKDVEGERDDLLIEIHELEGERDEFEGRFELEKEKNGKLVEEVEMRNGEIEGWKGRVDQLENELEGNTSSRKEVDALSNKLISLSEGYENAKIGYKRREERLTSDLNQTHVFSFLYLLFYLLL